MNRRTLWILLGALAFIVLAIFLWWWFFRSVPETPDTGEFGASGPGAGQTGGTTPPSNIGTPLQPGQTTIGGTTQTGGGSSTGGSTGSTGGTSGGSLTPGVSVGVTITVTTSTPGVSWLGGNNVFNPTPINPVDGGDFGALPVLTGSSTLPSDNYDNNMDGLLIGLGIAGLGCAAFLVPGPGSASVGTLLSVHVKNDADDNKNFLDCITRTIGRAAVEQITRSIVNWINSGFQGKPSFITNYQQFFTNIADQAAGEFIRGTKLSFLCSAFMPQVRIAIALSYAQGGSTPSCTLTQVTNNINRFMQRWDQGGWQAFVSFTTVPANNPYLGYMQGQDMLAQTLQRAQRTGQLDITLGAGFLSQQECTGPLITTGPNAGQKGPPCRILTPGQMIGNTIADSTFRQTYDQLNLAKSFDEIISALIRQLMIRVAYQGLANLTPGGDYANNFLTAEMTEAQAKAAELLAAMRNAIATAQQYGYTKQGMITDVQSMQTRLQDLANCYIGRSDTVNQQDTEARMQTLETQVTLLNEDITRANAAIATIQTMQTTLAAATTPADILAVETDFQAKLGDGTLITSTHVTQAQQDRASLQSQLSTLGDETSTKLNQCYATVF